MFCRSPITLVSQNYTCGAGDGDRLCLVCLEVGDNGLAGDGDLCFSASFLFDGLGDETLACDGADLACLPLAVDVRFRCEIP